jgi:type IV secretory pathway VirB10-like protein
MPKLKVYCTPIGFHDAYVAATSQKAALEAWGSDANLFTRGVAEQVDDPELTEEPLANPGVVIKRLRGSLDEQLAALPKDPAARRSTKATGSKAAKPVPRPDRTKLHAAEAELSDLQRSQAEEEQAIARREAELASERRKMIERHRQQMLQASKKVEAARADYDAAISKWRA